MNQNKTSFTTADKDGGQAQKGLEKPQGVPSYMRFLGFKSMDEVPGWNTPVFPTENPKVRRPEGWEPAATPEFLEGDNRLRAVSKVHLHLSANPLDFYVNAHRGGPVFEGVKPDGVTDICVIAEFPGTDTSSLFVWDMEALKNPGLRATTDVELLLDSIDEERMVFKTRVHGEEVYFVLIEQEEK